MTVFVPFVRLCCLKGKEDSFVPHGNDSFFSPTLKHPSNQNGEKSVTLKEHCELCETGSTGPSFSLVPSRRFDVFYTSFYFFLCVHIYKKVPVMRTRTHSGDLRSHYLFSSMLRHLNKHGELTKTLLSSGDAKPGHHKAVNAQSCDTLYMGTM